MLRGRPRARGETRPLVVRLPVDLRAWCDQQAKRLSWPVGRVVQRAVELVLERGEELEP